jgi:rubrerythrin
MRSVKELLAVTEALERESAAHYRALSARMARRGDAAMASLFDMLAGIADSHANHIAERCRALLGHSPEPVPLTWDVPAHYKGEDEVRGATLGAYQALAFAVRNEERAFAFHTYVAAEAENPELRALAEELARDELKHAALLRHHRRRAFHARRPSALEVPRSVEALRSLARRWDTEAAAAHAALAMVLDKAGAHADAAIFRRLAADEDPAASATTAADIPKLRSAVDGLRLLEEGFERYALIAERADDEHVMAEAQQLAAQMVARLASTGGARSTMLLDARGENDP